ncbi:MAG: C39 family peptidase [Patescibacteria group bacterium]
MKKVIFLFLALVVILAVGLVINYKYGHSNSNFAASPSPVLLSSPTPTPEQSTSSSLPSSYLISGFPFQTQAPLGNWDTLHEEACEEATLILFKYWQTGASLSAQTMENQIQAIVAWENANGYPQDLTSAQLVLVAKDYYQINDLTVNYNVSIESIKREIAQNHPVIVPAAGQLLGNPYYTAPGPVYHMLLIIGYNQNNFIVQDVGTKHGDHYQFNATILYNAIHDWAGRQDNIDSGRKAMIISGRKT